MKLSSFLRTSPSPITSHFMLFSFSSSSSSCTCFTLLRQIDGHTCLAALYHSAGHTHKLTYTHNAWGEQDDCTTLNHPHQTTKATYKYQYKSWDFVLHNRSTQKSYKCTDLFTPLCHLTHRVDFNIHVTFAYLQCD